MDKNNTSNKNPTNSKMQVNSFLQKHSIILFFSVYWLIVIILAGFFLYLTLISTEVRTFYSYLLLTIIILLLGAIGHRYFHNLINKRDSLINLMTTFMLVIASISGIFTYLIMLLFADLIERLPNFRFFGDEGDWINFIGIIIAGLITMLGITITINHQQKIRDEDLKNQLLPLVEVALYCFLPYNPKALNRFNVMSPWYLKIQNIGDNPLRNLKVDILEAYFFNNQSDKDFCILPINFENTESLKSNLIAINKVHEIEIQISQELLPIEFYKYLKLYFHLEYYDLSLKNIHTHEVYFDLELISKEGEFTKFGYKNWNLISMVNNFIS